VKTATFSEGLFTGRHALVVGGTSGIGAAIAQAFADLGASVAVTGATAAEVEAVRGGCASASVLDVRDDDAVRALVDRLPSLDFLVNCAGIIRRGAELDPAVFADVIDVNLSGTMRCCAAAREKLRASQGVIVNTASMLSFQGGGGIPGYSASKGGVMQLTKSLAIAYAADGVRVNAIAPGWVRTALTQPLQDDAARSAAVLARTPLGRWADPADIAGAVLFLCSPAARFITGIVLPIDGGYQAY